MATATTATTATHGKSDLVAVTLTAEQADRLLGLLEQEIAAQKNRLIDSVLSKTDYNKHAVSLAQDAEDLNNIAAAFRRLKI